MAQLESFREIRHSPEFRRFLSINQGLNETGVFLQNYVVTILQGIHDRIKNNLAGLPPCGQSCSEVYRNEQRWCQTCRDWKRELEQYFRNNWIRRDVKWHKLKSGTWPAGYRDTLDVFLPQFMHQPRHDLQDITTVLFLFENITDFNVVPLDLIKAIRKLRNRYKHGGLMKATQRDTNKTFMLLRNLIQIQDISATLDMNSVSVRLQKIENGELLQYEFDIMARMQNLDQNVEYIRQEIDDLSRITRTLNEISSLAKHTLISLTVFILVGVQAMPRQYTYRQLRTLLLITIVASLYHQVGIIHPKQACFDENYSYPWSNEVKLMGYLKSHHNLTGRKWLLGDLEATLRNTSSNSPGILLAADMGYGKSAIVSHLACAQFGEAGNWVTSRILAIHVCRYDALNSQNPALMIRRLIGLIAKRMPGYSSNITMSETVLQELSQRYCLVDPKGCMDQGVLFPLNDIIEPPTEPLIVIIDALDECETFGNPYASIADLLSKSMHSFPAWIKFLVTSRYDIRLLNKFPTLNKIILRESDDRNIEDVKLYIQSWLQKDKVLVRNIRACLMNNSVNEIIENLLEASLGNFLHITHALKYWSASSNSACQKLPSSLDKVIELNFKRLYGENGEWFDSSRPVFAVICASAEPLTIHMLFGICRQVLNITDMVTFKIILVNGSHFIRIENDIASLTHIAVYEWLTSPKRIGSSFFVNASAGHTAIASYLVQRLQRENETVDIVDLAMHAIESQQQGLISRIRKLSLNSVIQNQSEENILYRLVTKTNSYEIASLVLHFIDDVDAGRKSNVTAAFNASALGQQYTLMALLDAGADITFRASRAVFCWHCPQGFALERPDLNHGLLDIAVERDHLTIVNVLLERNKTLILDSEFETSAFPLACAKGRILYLKKFVEIFPHLANQRCLHHAAFNGHIQLVQYLNEMGVVDTCLTCDRILNLINVVYMDHGMIRMRRSMNEPDILWEMNLETALHAAAKAGHTEIVTYLISAKQNAINCVDRFGKTPFLTAVSYNHTDIVLLLGSSSDVNQKCSSPCQCCQRSVINNLYMIGVRDESQLCSPDTSAIHIMTSNNFYYMLSQIDLQYVNRINWTIADGEGIQPLHIASCHGFASIIRLILPKVVLNISQFLTLNGSSPFHSAVSCLSAEGLQVLLEFFSKKDIGIQDSYGMTLLHYLSRIDFKRPYLYQTWEDEIILVDILDTIRKYRNIADLLQEKDVYGRNVYHYIVANGLFRIFNEMFGVHSLQMLSSPDVNGQTPLVFSIENLPYHFHMDDKNTYILPAWCQLHQIFLKNCSITTHNFSILMSSKEYMIIVLVEKLKDQIWEDSFEIYVHNFIVKGSLYLTAYWLSKFKSFDVKNELGESPTTTYLKYGKDHCTGFLLFGGERRHLLLQCGKPLYQSPLHAIMMFINQRFWFFKPRTPYMHVHNINLTITGECVNPDAFEELVSNIPVKALEECFDEEGFNILHRALLGSGHIRPFGLLKQMGMSVTPTAHGFGGITTAFLLHEHLFKKKKVYYNFAEEREPNEEIQETVTVQLLCPENMRTDCGSRLSYFKESRHTKHQQQRFLFQRQSEVDLDSFDVSSAGFVSANAKSISLEDICSRTKPLLSIVHLAAINGLLQTLKEIANRWGTDVLGCVNVHYITPLYLAEKFRQDDVAKYLRSLDIRPMPIRGEIEFLMKLYVIPTRSSFFGYGKYGIYEDSAVKRDSVIGFSAYIPPRRLLECIYNLGRSSKTMTLLFRTHQCLYIALKSYYGSMYTHKSTHFTVELLKLRAIEHRLNEFNISIRTRAPFTCSNRYLNYFFRQGTCSPLTFISKRSYLIFQRFGALAAIADQKIHLRRALVSLWRRIYSELMQLWCDFMENLRIDLQMAFTKIEDWKIESDVKEYISQHKQRCITLSNTVRLYFNDYYKYLKILMYTYPHNVLKRGDILGWL